jgi:hypothetical protein
VLINVGAGLARNALLKRSLLEIKAVSTFFRWVISRTMFDDIFIAPDDNPPGGNLCRSTGRD